MCLDGINIVSWSTAEVVLVWGVRTSSRNQEVDGLNTYLHDPETLAIEKEYAPLEHNPGAYSVGK
jgi:hypothetical protein